MQRIAAFVCTLMDSTYDVVVFQQKEIIDYLLEEDSLADQLWIERNGDWRAYASMNYSALAHEHIDHSVDSYDKLVDWVNGLFPNASSVIGFEANVPYYIHKKWVSSFPDTVTWKHISGSVSSFRQTKNFKEMCSLHKAADLACRGFLHMLQFLHEGVTEQELISKLYIFWLHSEPTSSPSFPCMVLFGENSSAPHGRPSSRSLRKGDVVLIDIGVTLEGFCSDLTRTFSFGEPLDHEFFHAWRTVLAAKCAATDALRKTFCPALEPDRASEEVLKAAGYCKMHSIGHGVGVLVHEAPGYIGDDPMPIDACVTVEPGVYLAGRFGIRLEDTLFLTPAGPLIFTPLPIYPYGEMYLSY